MLKQFLNDTTGAVTVDWVVLTAAVTGLGLATIGVIAPALENVATDIETALMEDAIVRTSFAQLNYIPYDTGTFSLWYDAAMAQDAAWITNEMDGLGGPTGETFEQNGTQVQHDTYAALQTALEEQGGTLTSGWSDARNF